MLTGVYGVYNRKQIPNISTTNLNTTKLCTLPHLQAITVDRSISVLTELQALTRYNNVH